MLNNNVFGLIYAGEQNMNLIELASKRAIGALPVGGRYRAIDFIMSNMVNSGVRNVGVIAQKNYHSLMDHLGSGKDWDLNRKNDGLFILPPFDTNENQGSYRGLCDAVKNSMGYIPVSYTHLDVYKRQCLSRSRNSSEKDQSGAYCLSFRR